MIAFIKKHLITISFVFGFASDSILLPSPDSNFSWIIGLAYVLLISAFILLREWILLKASHYTYAEKYAGYSSNIINFFSGSLLSFVFIYYFRSSSFIISLPVMFMIFGMILANEMIKDKKYRRLVDIIVLFVSSIFFFVFAVPIFTGSISNKVFWISFAFSILLHITFLLLLAYICKKKIRFFDNEIKISLGIVAVISLLYITKSLPAVPLSLNSASVYSSIVKSGDVYTVQSEKRSLSQKLFSLNTYHYKAGEALYFFASVHAPVKIGTTVTHVWEYYDNGREDWTKMGSVSFALLGGRSAGYRGYSVSTNPKDGLWRVSVKTEDDRTIGRYSFKMIESTEEVNRETLAK
jgi:hypothetical protein